MVTIYHTFVKGTDDKIIHFNSYSSLVNRRKARNIFRKHFPNTKILKTSWRII